jgi:Fur family ferric uptake transcriptional regulator
MKNYPDSTFKDIESSIRDVGGRVTYPRVQVLNLLKSAQKPLSHGDIEMLLSQNALPEIDRVTLYRVLDWFIDVGLVSKVANLRGIFCFTATDRNIEHRQHMHFRCTDCGSVTCLDVPLPFPPELPNGFHFTSMEFDISGECPDCVHNHTRSSRNSLGAGVLR